MSNFLVNPFVFGCSGDTTTEAFNESQSDDVASFNSQSGENDCVGMESSSGISKHVIKNCVFRIYRTSGATGNVYCKIYNNLVTPANELASSAAVDIETVTTDTGGQDVTFTFSSCQTLAAGVSAQNVVLEYDSGDSGKYCFLLFETTASVKSGWTTMSKLIHDDPSGSNFREYTGSVENNVRGVFDSIVGTCCS